MTRPSIPSSCSGLRTSTTSASSRRSIAACSRKLPWTARTPMRTRRLYESAWRLRDVREAQRHGRRGRDRAAERDGVRAGGEREAGDLERRGAARLAEARAGPVRDPEDERDGVAAERRAGPDAAAARRERR